MLQVYPSPLRGEGRVRGVSFRESPRDSARNLRHRQTDAERRLWSRLRDRRLVGATFARRVPIGPCIVDFVEALTASPSPRPSPRRGEGEGRV
jgi:hypothetical protein